MNKKTLLGVVGGVLVCIVLVIALVVVFRPPPVVEEPAMPSLGIPSPQAVRLAEQAELLVHRLRDDSGGGTANNLGGQRLTPMILVFAAQAGDQEARERALEQIVSVTTPGHEPGGAGGLFTQDEMAAYALLALARQDAVLWAEVDPETQQRADLVMTAGLVGSAFTTSDNNPFIRSGGQERTIEGNFGVGRNWNPNYREGMFGAVLAGRAYFGEQGARAVLADFELTDFLQRVAASELSNIQAIWEPASQERPESAPTGADIAEAVHDWSAYGYRLDDPMGIMLELARDTFSRTVNCGLNDGAGVVDPEGVTAGMLVSGCDQLPNRGALGMIREFDSVDAEGPRSSAFYGYSTAQGVVVNRVLARASGAWEPGAVADEIETLSRVGIPDFFYKTDRGYHNYSLGESRGILRSDDPDYHFVILRSGWRDVLGES